MISKSRPTKGRMGTAYHIEIFYQSKQSCKNCIYYEKEDSSCSKNPIVLSEVGFSYYKNCKYFEVSKNKDSTNDKRNKKIARVMSHIIENEGDLKSAAKSFNISLYQALVIYNDMSDNLMPMNEANISRLSKYGLSNKKIAEFYGIKENNLFKESNNKIEKKIFSKMEYNSQVGYNNENASILKEAIDDICGLCNKKDKSSRVYYIDVNRNKDKDSILNMINLCKNCESKVNKNRNKYEDILKEKSQEIMEMIISFI